MKTIPRTLLALLLTLAGVGQSFAQGSLTPPGAPAPTMKSLDQIEPARPLIVGQTGVAIGASGTITISAAGNYWEVLNLFLPFDLTNPASAGGDAFATVEVKGRLILWVQAV